MVEPAARGNPQSPLRWTCKGASALAAELTSERRPGRATPKSPKLCEKIASACRATARPRKGTEPIPDRDAQFQHINRAIKARLSAAGRPRHFHGHEKKGIDQQLPGPEPPVSTKRRQQIRSTDMIFPVPRCRARYSLRDLQLGRNVGFVDVGTDHDPARSPWLRSAAGGALRATACIPGLGGC